MEGEPSANEVVRKALGVDVPRTLAGRVVQETVELMDAAGNRRTVDFLGSSVEVITQPGEEDLSFDHGTELGSEG